MRRYRLKLAEPVHAHVGLHQTSPTRALGLASACRSDLAIGKECELRIDASPFRFIRSEDDLVCRP